MTAYVDYVTANYEGYVSLVKGAAGGNETLRGIYEEVRVLSIDLTERIFREDVQGELIADTPRNRLRRAGLVGDGRGARHHLVHRPAAHRPPARGHHGGTARLVGDATRAARSVRTLARPQS